MRLMELRELQDRLDDWRKKNFPTSGATTHLLGAVEEIGELAHAHIKEEQGIRGSAKLHQNEAMDAVGDTVIYLMQYCSNRGWSFEKILNITAEHVLGRDWIADPVAGSAVNPASAIELLKEHDGDPDWEGL